MKRKGRWPIDKKKKQVYDLLGDSVGSNGFKKNDRGVKRKGRGGLQIGSKHEEKNRKRVRKEHSLTETKAICFKGNFWGETEKKSGNGP